MLSSHITLSSFFQAAKSLFKLPKRYNYKKNKFYVEARFSGFLPRAHLTVPVSFIK